ncbi:hypothetical protein Pme01_55970 [Planosporangium mesophilum]|uniref:Uncharacterized protein n=2 Tax=Planosporangium mesophilum TaxID=689768 RepID=A0A8J3X303_9ACTN|nr:hypothetical protein Pme01_55970 [Planosporangium mesophilum]
MAMTVPVELPPDEDFTTAWGIVDVDSVGTPAASVLALGVALGDALADGRADGLVVDWGRAAAVGVADRAGGVGAAVPVIVKVAFTGFLWPLPSPRTTCRPGAFNPLGGVKVSRARQYPWLEPPERVTGASPTARPSQVKATLGKPHWPLLAENM